MRKVPLNSPFEHEGRTFIRIVSDHTCDGCVAESKTSRTTLLCMTLPACSSVFNGEVAGSQFREVFPENVTDLMQVDPPNQRSGELLEEDPDHGGPLTDSYGMVAGSTTALARDTDPQTSKDAAKTVGGGKLVDLILQQMQQSKGVLDLGFTGKELADILGKPLNSITPRFSPLRRAGLIHAAGRRDRQIVWKLGNGVGHCQ